MISKPIHIIAVHQAICQSAGCPYASQAADPYAQCENGHWGRYSPAQEPHGHSVPVPQQRPVPAQSCGGCSQVKEFFTNLASTVPVP